MSYGLGIDVGTSYTAASVCRTIAGNRGEPETVPLGARSAAMSSVLYLGPDGQVTVGDGAERRSLTDPDRVVREFKRRIGDDVPLVVGEEAHTAHEIAAAVVRWVVDHVTAREGGPAERIVLTHPASWGPHKKGLVTRALVAAGLPEISLLAEPVAAATSYAAQARVETGATVAVYDLGGGTFDAAVVRKTGVDTFELLGTPEGLDRLGGVDFDDAVFAHVRSSVGPELMDLDPSDPSDPSDPDVLAAMSRLRRECTEAKEALSVDTDATIPVLLPGTSTQVRLVRGELEDMIRGSLQETVASLARAMSSAGVAADDVDAVLLVGGSSRVPLVAQLVSAELGRPIAIDADPKTTIAAGAALAAAPGRSPEGHDGATKAVVEPAAPDVATPGTAAPAAPEEAPARPARVASMLELPVDEPASPPPPRLKQLVTTGLIAVALIGVAALVPIAITENSATTSDAAASEGSLPNPGGTPGTLAAPIDGKVSNAGASATAGRGPASDEAVNPEPTRSNQSAPARTAPASTGGGRGGGPDTPAPGSQAPGSGVPLSSPPVEQPEQPGPTGEPEQPGPTGEPEQPGPTGEPEQPGPTGEPEQPGPTGEPEQPGPTGEPEQPGEDPGTGE